jgi:hypothetical protein
MAPPFFILALDGGEYFEVDILVIYRPIFKEQIGVAVIFMRGLLTSNLALISPYVPEVPINLFG